MANTSLLSRRGRRRRRWKPGVGWVSRFRHSQIPHNILLLYIVLVCQTLIGSAAALQPSSSPPSKTIPFHHQYKHNHHELDYNPKAVEEDAMQNKVYRGSALDPRRTERPQPIPNAPLRPPMIWRRQEPAPDLVPVKFTTIIEPGPPPVTKEFGINAASSTVVTRIIGAPDQSAAAPVIVSSTTTEGLFEKVFVTDQFSKTYTIITKAIAGVREAGAQESPTEPEAVVLTSSTVTEGAIEKVFVKDQHGSTLNIITQPVQGQAAGSSSTSWSSTTTEGFSVALGYILPETISPFTTSTIGPVVPMEGQAASSTNWVTTVTGGFSVALGYILPETISPFTTSTIGPVVPVEGQAPPNTNLISSTSNVNGLTIVYGYDPANTAVPINSITKFEGVAPGVIPPEFTATITEDNAGIPVVKHVKYVNGVIAGTSTVLPGDPAVVTSNSFVTSTSFPADGPFVVLQIEMKGIEPVATITIPPQELAPADGGTVASSSNTVTVDGQAASVVFYNSLSSPFSTSKIGEATVEGGTSPFSSSTVMIDNVAVSMVYFNSLTKPYTTSALPQDPGGPLASARDTITWSTVTDNGQAVSIIGYNAAGTSVTTSALPGQAPPPAPSAFGPFPTTSTVYEGTPPTLTKFIGLDSNGLTVSISTVPIEGSARPSAFATKTVTEGTPPTIMVVELNEASETLYRSTVLGGSENEVNFERTNQAISTQTVTTVVEGATFLHLIGIDSTGSAVSTSTVAYTADPPAPTDEKLSLDNGLTGNINPTSGKVAADGSPLIPIDRKQQQQQGGPIPQDQGLSSSSGQEAGLSSSGQEAAPSTSGQAPVPLPSEQAAPLPTSGQEAALLPPVEEAAPLSSSSQETVLLSSSQMAETPLPSSNITSPTDEFNKPEDFPNGALPEIPAAGAADPAGGINVVGPSETIEITSTDEAAPASTQAEGSENLEKPMQAPPVVPPLEREAEQNQLPDIPPATDGVISTPTSTSSSSTFTSTTSSSTTSSIPPPEPPKPESPKDTLSEASKPPPPEPPKSTSTSDRYDWVPSSSLLQNPSATEITSEQPAPTQTDNSETVTENEEPVEEPEPKSALKPQELASSTAKAALPSEWPSSIVPQQDEAELEEGEEIAPVGLAGARAVKRPADTSLVSILFTRALSWSWLLSQSDASAQVFAYMPVLITSSLGIDSSLVTTVSLEAWEPPDWSGEGADVRSVWVGHMPSNKVDYLAALLVNSSSEFYTAGKPITKQLSTCVDPSLPLLSLQNSLGIDPSGEPSTEEEADPDAGKMSNKTTAFVASAAALGAIVVAIGAFFGSRYAMKKRADVAGNTPHGSRYSGSNSSFSSRRQQRNDVGAGAAAGPMDDDDFPRDSEYYGTQSEYLDGDRDTMRDSYASRPPTGPLPEPPAAYRRSGMSESSRHLERNGESSYYPTERSYGATGRSGSGSSVQSEILGSRQASGEIPIRDTWWKHASQWGDTGGPGDPNRGYSVMSDPAPKSGRVVTLERPFSASTYSTLRTADGGGFNQHAGPFGQGTPFNNRFANSKPSKISAPYLQDNSLML